MSENQEIQKKNNGIYITIILLLLIGLGFMAFLWSNKNKDLNECSNKNALLETDIKGMNDMMSGYVEGMTKDLKTDFKNMLATYDALIAKDASKADSIEVQKEKIQNLLDELNRTKRYSAHQIMTLQKENETLRSIMKGYVKQIDSLNTLNLKLTSELDTKSNQLSSTINERDQFKTQAEENAAQVKKGSKLQAFAFSSGGLKMKLNNTTESTNKARNCIQIKSAFTISENPLTKSGKKYVYMQVTNPDGKILQSKASNTIQTDEGVVAYSDKKEIDYQNQRIDVAVYYDLQGENAIKGNYKVKIFCDGQLIGSDSFTLK
jgi:hypothetical protein